MMKEIILPTNMYTMTHKQNITLAFAASCFLGFDVYDFPRYRNVFLKADDCPFKEKQIDFFIYSRMGAGNSEYCWDENDKFSYNCDCPACRINYFENANHELFKVVGQWDDDFDCTYRTHAIKLLKSRKIWEDFRKTGGIPADFIPEDIVKKYFREKNKGKR